MSYFPHAFQKMLIVNHATPIYDGDATDGATGTKTGLDLAAGQLGIVHGISNKIMDRDDTGHTYQEVPMFYLAQGSFYANDKVGKFHGGYQETVKSKGINPKYVSDFYRVDPKEAQNEIVEITSGLDCVDIACDTTYYLRVDVKGSPALRALTHNAYITAPAFSGCCDGDSANIDPNVIMTGWAEYINDNPTFNNFCQAQAWSDINNVASPIAAVATTAQALTMTAIEGTDVVAGDVVEFTPSTGSLTTDSTVMVAGSYLITVGTMDGAGLFSVGQTLTSDVTGQLLTGTKVVELVSGGGGAGSVLRIDKPVQSSDTAVLTGTGAVMAVVKAVSADTLTLYSMVGEKWAVDSTTDITAFTTTSLAAIKVWHRVYTANDPLKPAATSAYTPLTGNDADHSEALIVLKSAYVDTVFSDCSFNKCDKHDIEPLQIEVSIVDETGDPCNTTCFTTTEVVNAEQGKGYGETVLRQLILAKRYRQEQWKDDPRMREVLGDTALTEVDRTDKYYMYHILHSIPRKSNPSGMLDNDQYLITIAVPDSIYLANDGSGEAFPDFEAWMNQILSSAGNSVQLRIEK